MRNYYTYYSNRLAVAPAPASFYTVGDFWEEDTNWVYEGYWLYFAGDYHGGACYYTDPGREVFATVNKPVRGNALKINHGGDPAPTSVLYQYREINTTQWRALGIVPEIGEHILPLPSATAYYEIRATNNPQQPDKYCVVDYLEII